MVLRVCDALSDPDIGYATESEDEPGDHGEERIGSSVRSLSVGGFLEAEVRLVASPV